jgi:hypothetical protein
MSLPGNWYNSVSVQIFVLHYLAAEAICHCMITGISSSAMDGGLITENNQTFFVGHFSVSDRRQFWKGATSV